MRLCETSGGRFYYYTFFYPEIHGIFVTYPNVKREKIISRYAKFGK